MKLKRYGSYWDGREWIVIWLSVVLLVRLAWREGPWVIAVMMPTSRLVAFRLALLVAVAASIAHWVDQFRASPHLCGYGSGCQRIVEQGLDRILGLPLSVMGAFLVVTLFELSLIDRPTARTAARWGGRIAALLAAALIVVQIAWLRTACVACMLVDLPLVLAGMCTLGCPADTAREPLGARRGWAWQLFLVMSIAFPISLQYFSPDPLPPLPVREWWVPDRVNVIEIMDFDCEHCRNQHKILKGLREKYSDRIHFVQLTAPMPQHEHARIASRAFLCASRLGKGDEMAEALVAATLLSSESCEKLAQAVGIPVSEYRTCIADPSVDRQMERDLQWVKEAAPGGLPALWIQAQQFTGLQPRETLEAAILRAEAQIRR